MKRVSLAAACATLVIIMAPAAPRPVAAAQPAVMPPATPDAVGLSPEHLQNATALLRQFVADRKIAGAVAAVARKGRVAYLEPVGLQSFESGTPMTERSLFRVYSMTKAVTAVAVMMLQEEGKFRLDDPVAKYLPEFASMTVQAADGSARPPARAITIEDLLLHTAGLSHRTSDLYRRLGVRSRAIGLPQFVTNITRAPLMEDPGTRFRYSEATTVLGRLVEIWSGSSFDGFVTSRVLRPLGMMDTAFWVEPGARPRLTTVYQSTQGGPLAPFEIEEVPFTERPALMEGAVGLVSTAPDFLRFGQMLLNKGALGDVRLLGAKTVEAMTANGLAAPILQQRGGAVGWGLANVDVVVAPGSRGYLTAVGEYGWDGSAGTFFSVDPATETVVVLLTQNLPANPDGLRQKFKAAVNQAIVEPAPGPPAGPTGDVCPPAGYPVARLQELKAAGFAVPSADARQALARQLTACLADARPALRDGVAFEALSTWMRAELLDTPTLIALRATLTADLDRPDAQGFRAPFSALVLAEVARTDRIKPWMTAAGRAALVEAASRYLSGVRDYRGFSDTEGWRHGVAHGADFVLQLALNPAVTRPQADRLLGAVAAQVAPARAVSYIAGEPERLARPVLFIAQRGLHTDEEWAGWLSRVTAPAPLASWADAYASELGLARRHNTRAFLLGLYAAVQETDDAAIRRLLPPVRAALQALR